MTPGKYLLISMMCLVSVVASSQDMQFSQVYSNPLYLNPAAAGTELNTRVMLSYRNQWPALGYGYRAHGIGIDHYLSNANSGLGLTFTQDIAGLHRLSNTRFSLCYSQHIRLGREVKMALGVKASAGQKTFDDSELLFADQVITGAEESASLPFLNLSTNYADVSFGGIAYGRRWFIGSSVHHINQPNVSLMDGDEPLMLKFSLHGGGNITINDGRGSDPFRSINLSFNYKSQGNWDQLDLGGYLLHEQFQVGLWYRGLPLKAYAPGYSNHESLVFLVGWIGDGVWSVGYSYDLTLSELSGFTGGSHELSMKFAIPPRHKPPKRRIVPCAKF